MRESVASTFLLAPFTEDEIKKEVWNSDSNKIPWHDGTTLSSSMSVGMS